MDGIYIMKEFNFNWSIKKLKFNRNKNNKEILDLIEMPQMKKIAISYQDNTI